MLKSELVTRILGRTILEIEDIDQIVLRNILEEIVQDYQVSQACTAISNVSDLKDKIVIFLASKNVEGLAKGSTYNYGLQLNRFSKYIGKSVDEITSMDIRVYLSKVVNDYELAKSSMSNMVSILKSFFSWLETEEYINKSPMRKIKQPKTDKYIRKALSIEEIERLRNACKTLRQKSLLEFLFSTGCRLSELVNVDIKDIDWNNQSLKVIGKGSKERIIYFSVKAKLSLKEYLASRQDNVEALFVTSRKPYKRLGNRSVQREVKNIARLANINKSIYPHLFRHSMATLGLNSGASLTSIQKLLGHEDPATTQIYAKISQEDVKNEYRKYLNQ